MKLIVRDVEFQYPSVYAIKDISLKLSEYEIMGLVGPNGSGKSTLLKCISKILSPQRGVILLDGKDIEKLNRMEIARKVGYVPQSLLNSFPATVFDTVLIGRRPHISWRTTDKDVEKVLEVLKTLNIENLAMRDINELSGGEKQKVFIARTLVQEAEVLLLDEPTSNLDIKHQLEMMEIIKKLVKSAGLCAIIAMHDLNLAARYSDKILMMKNGKVFSAGTPIEVLTPKNIEVVYEVKVEVWNLNGIPHIIPIAPIQQIDLLRGD